MSTTPAVITSVADLRALRARFAVANETVGFIPTMGYLHEGHMTLIRQSLAANDRTIVSIFVNPSQFAPGEDLDTYPRDLAHDLAVIDQYVDKSFGKFVDAVFTPSVAEMYPSGFDLDVSKQHGAFVEVLGVSSVLEGRTRPAFFRGVSTVVTKLLNAVCPTTAYFGQKDVQQTVVVKTLVRDLLMNVKIEVVPTVRNDSGLALSSRNKYLSQTILDQVTCIYKSMQSAYEEYAAGNCNVTQLTNEIVRTISKTNDQFKIDYVAFNDPLSLAYIDKIDTNAGCILSMAVYVPNDVGSKETTRLIDNMIFPPL